MQMTRRFYLISTDEKFSNQFSIHFLDNPTQFLVTFTIRNMD